MGESRYVLLSKQRASFLFPLLLLLGLLWLLLRRRLRPYQWLRLLQLHQLGLLLRLEPQFRLRLRLFLLGVGPLVPLRQRMRPGRGSPQLWVGPGRGGPQLRMGAGRGNPKLL